MTIVRFIVRFASALAVLSAARSSSAAVPEIITQQGRLYNGVEASVSGTHNVTFAIYADATIPDPIGLLVLGVIVGSALVIALFLSYRSEIADWFRPKWRHSDPKVRRAAMTWLTDQSVLVDIAEKDESSEVRVAATARVTDQSVLLGIAKSDTDSDVCKAATARVTDQSALVDIANNAKNLGASVTAVARVTDQSILVDIAVKHKHGYVREAAMACVTDQTILADIAMNGKDPEVRKAAVECISQDDVLAKIARTPTADPVVAKLARNRVRDVSLVDDIVPLYLKRKPRDWDAECIRSVLLDMRVVHDDGKVGLGSYVNSQTDENFSVYSKDVHELPLEDAVGKIDRYWSTARADAFHNRDLSYKDGDVIFEFRKVHSTYVGESINVVRTGQRCWKVCEYDSVMRLS